MSLLLKIGAVLVFITVVAVGSFYYLQKKDISTTTLVPTAKNDVTFREKIGQMVMLGFRGTQAYNDSYIAQTIKDLNIGGIILFDYDVPSKSFPRNIVSPSQTPNPTKTNHRTELSSQKAFLFVPLINKNRFHERFLYIQYPIYLIDLYPPKTPFLDKTMCHS